MVGVEDSWLAEFGPQARVLVQGLQLLAGFFRQEIAGLAWRFRSNFDQVDLTPFFDPVFRDSAFSR